MNKDFKNMLKAANLKATLARLEILSIFSRNSNPLNAENVKSKMKDKEADLVTIYRTLTSFEEAGILKRVNLQKDSVYYEFADRHHHHIVCVECGDIEDFEECGLAKVSADILKRSSKFKKVNEHAFELFGLCKVCSK